MGRNIMNWKDFEYFDEEWKHRIKKMAEFIPESGRIVDLGCGRMWLKEIIDEKNHSYIGVDYTPRDENTIVCDFNLKEFPNIEAEVYFASGVLEYVKNYKWFISNIARHSQRCILSYCPIEVFNNKKERIDLGWKNHLNSFEIIKLFKKANMQLRFLTETNTRNKIFVFDV